MAVELITRRKEGKKEKFTLNKIFFSGIDKLTEKSQVSEDGTMVTVPKTETPHSPEHGVLSGASDTESNSGRDNEVRGLSL